jgi:hypothetical protein
MKFQNLSFISLFELRTGKASLFRINKEHRLTKELINKYEVLNKAEYVIYPNRCKGAKLFLDEEMNTLKVVKEGVSEFILKESVVLKGV